MAEFGFENWPAILMAAGPAVLNVGIAAFVMIRMRRNALTYVFALFVVAMAVWQTNEACTRAARTLETAEMCRGLFSPGAAVVAPLGMHFALLFSERRYLAHSPVMLGLLYGPAIVFEALNRAGFNDLHLVFNPLWGWQTQPPPPLVSTFSSYWIILLTFGTLIVLASFARRLPADDERKNQARLVAGGLAVPLVIGAALQVILPTVFQARGIPLTSVSLTIFSLATVVALRNYSFLSLPTVEERLVEARQVIADQQAMLAQAERMAHLGSWEWDASRNVVRWSPEMFRIFGVDPENSESTYEAYFARVHPDDRPNVERAVGAALRSKRAFEFDHRTLPVGGEDRIIHARGQVHTDERGEVVRLTGTAQDVTRQREAERVRTEAREKAQEVERLKELNQFKTRFINTAAHELFTPLTPIRATLYTMRKQAERDGDTALLGTVNVLSRNCDRLQRLVSDLLDASRLEAQKIGLNRQDVDVGRLVKEAADSFRAQSEEAGVDLEVHVEPGVRISGDPDRLTQVVFNLLSNAIKFTPRGGRVTIRAQAFEDGAQIRVEDTGVGIEPELQRILFRPFSRAHAETDPDQPGTGLGLYITKGIVDLHDGRVSCWSAGKGKGTTFTVTLPA